MLSTLFSLLIPEALRNWAQVNIIAKLGFVTQDMWLGLSRGLLDASIFVMLSIGILLGSTVYMNSEYTLTKETQRTVMRWAIVSEAIAQKVDIPREVPLVLWLKESNMKAVNPDLCTGIMGVYDLVQSGEHDCFTPGPITDKEIAEQLAIGAIEYKKRCALITYHTQDTDTIKRCYFAYNAGVTAAATKDFDQSAYVMNKFSPEYEDMPYQDVVLGNVVVKSLGAWPAHLAIQGLLMTQMEREQRPFVIAAVDTAIRIYDKVQYDLSDYEPLLPSLSVAPLASETVTVEPLAYETFEFDIIKVSPAMFYPANDAVIQTCLGEPHREGNPDLLPRLNPVTEDAVLTQTVHGCSYNLPGIDISSLSNPSTVLYAPMPGTVTTYTDIWYNTVVRIENEEWVAWLLHSRSYIVEQGEVSMGDPIAVMGSIGNSTGPHVHYTLYDKVNQTYVNPRDFVPKK